MLQGTVLRAEVAGCLQMKSFLLHGSGRLYMVFRIGHILNCSCVVPNTVEVKIGLNKDLVIGKADQGSGMFKLAAYY